MNHKIKLSIFLLEIVSASSHSVVISRCKKKNQLQKKIRLIQICFPPGMMELLKKQSLIFVTKTTDTTNKDFVAAAGRIACFEYCGTLWSEQPMYFQLAFAIDEIKHGTAAPRMENKAAL